MINSIVAIRTKTYAQTIYLNGTNRLTARTEVINGVETIFKGVSVGYYTPVEQFAANTPIEITREDIDKALLNGWINQQEYDETIAFIPV